MEPPAHSGGVTYQEWYSVLSIQGISVHLIHSIPPLSVVRGSSLNFDCDSWHLFHYVCILLLAIKVSRSYIHEKAHGHQISDFMMATDDISTCIHSLMIIRYYSSSTVTHQISQWWMWPYCSKHTFLISMFFLSI